MEYTSIPPTRSIMCSKLFRTGPSGSVRALSLVRMRTESARLSTFQRWNAGPQGSPSPQVLSSAGFIYRGVTDHTQCFTCSVVISHWLPGHDPIIEHYRHSPTCEFLLSRGQQDDTRMQQSSSIPNTSHNFENFPPEVSGRSTDASLCKICYSKDMCFLFRPCGHLLTCGSCAEKLLDCPICRRPIFEKIRAFVSFE